MTRSSSPDHMTQKPSRELPWWSPQVTPLVYDYVKQVLDSNYLNEGELTSRFEQEIAKLAGTKHGVAVTSGTAAIFLALVAVGVGHGDEVLVPDVTFIATANAVTMTGARPVLIDIDPATLNIDPESMQRAVTNRTKAIVPVHVSGRAADLRSITELSRSYGLFVIEDAAEALMSSVKGKCLGTFGNAGCLSFSPNKTISTGQGGMILTDDDALHVRLRELKDQGRPTRGTGGDDIHHSIGYNFKLTNLQAAIGLGQLPVLGHRLERQRQIYRIYASELAEMQGIRLPGFRLESGEIPQWTDAIVDRRDELDQFLEALGVHCRRFWYPIHTQEPYRKPDDRFPNSVQILSHALWLPSAFTLSDEEVMTVCGFVREFLEST